MFLIRQRVDRRHTGKFRELLDVALGERANDRAMNHPRQHPRRVLDQFAAAELRICRIEINRFAAELANSDFKRDARARGRLGKNQRPGLSGQRLGRVPAAIRLEIRCRAGSLDLVARQLFDAERCFIRIARESLPQLTVFERKNRDMRSADRFDRSASSIDTLQSRAILPPLRFRLDSTPAAGE